MTLKLAADALSAFAATEARVFAGASRIETVVDLVEYGFKIGDKIQLEQEGYVGLWADGNLLSVGEVVFYHLFNNCPGYIVDSYFQSYPFRLYHQE